MDLIDINLDNNLASSWMASNKLFEIQNDTIGVSVKIYPVPATKELYVVCNEQVQRYVITDITGKIVDENSLEDIINIELLMPNIYILKLYLINGDMVIRKIIKE